MSKTCCALSLVLIAGRALAQDVEPPPAAEAPPQETGTLELSIEAQIEAPEVEAEVEVPAAVEVPRRAVPLPPEEDPGPPPQATLLHGFRLGYLYIFNTDTPLYGAEPDSQIYADRYDMRAPHLFMVGYEFVWRMIGYDWLNLLFIGNIMFAGFEQARFFPSANLMVGFEFARMAQLGIGVSVTPTKEEPAHVVIAAGWTPQIGSFHIPIHAFFVPDIEGHHKIGITAGVTFF